MSTSQRHDSGSCSCVSYDCRVESASIWQCHTVSRQVIILITSILFDKDSRCRVRSAMYSRTRCQSSTDIALVTAWRWQKRAWFDGGLSICAEQVASDGLPLHWGERLLSVPLGPGKGPYSTTMSFGPWPTYH